MSGTVRYLYGVVPALPELSDDVADLRGVDDAPVRVVAGGEVAAVVSDVPSDDFDEEALAAHLEHLDWLEAVARAHHGVVDAVAARTAVLPLRLATIYRDDAGVRAMLTAGRQEFAPRLARLAGHVEWGVKVFFVPPAADPSAGAVPGDGPAEGGAPPDPELSPGRAYLRTRRHERHARDSAYGTAMAAAERIHEAALSCAVEHTRHRVQQGPLAQGPFENIANDAYLVPADGSDAFRAAVAEAAAGTGVVHAEVTGPWAPYSFAAAEPADPAGTADGAGGTGREATAG
ncbi:GvpL/GvpF family gas vesicle protein [Streptomyces sp. NRRL S-118]|uniref:GvpL/GvpF family gas vesicle protein n=1 Tax=Streptomyces sp. NRRL S-118 TaxID=1463881 RepID=UPI000694E5A5|nr:GvpL/GvpF family gas vesicle protein [Streptomyces sp. NRRL S-118]